MCCGDRGEFGIIGAEKPISYARLYIQHRHTMRYEQRIFRVKELQMNDRATEGHRAAR